MSALHHSRIALYMLSSSGFLLFALSCGREQQIPVPYVPVNYTVYLSNPSNDHLLVPGGYLIIPDQGNLGIILYRQSFGDSEDFVAYDLTCTAEEDGQPVYSEDERILIERDVLLEASYLAACDNSINNKSVGNRAGAAIVAWRAAPAEARPSPLKEVSSVPSAS